MNEFEVKFTESSKEDLIRLKDVLEDAGYRVGRFVSWDQMSVTTKVDAPDNEEEAKGMKEAEIKQALAEAWASGERITLVYPDGNITGRVNRLLEETFGVVTEPVKNIVETGWYDTVTDVLPAEEGTPWYEEEWSSYSYKIRGGDAWGVCIKGGDQLAASMSPEFLKRVMGMQKLVRKVKKFLVHPINDREIRQALREMGEK